MFEGQQDNLELWNESRFIDPAFTKKFTRRGGFAGTSINSTYAIKRATEVFGPVGLGWGWIVTEDRYKDGPNLLTSEGVVIGHECVHVIRIRLWYKWKDQKGEIEHFGQTMFIEKTSSGLKTDEEHAKKSLTDAITKALSCIGIGAEIHLGMWDDNKYVAAQQREAQERVAPRVVENALQPAQTSRASGISQGDNSDSETIVPINAFGEKDGPSVTTPAIEEVKKEIDSKTTYEEISAAVAKGYAIARFYQNKELHAQFKKYAQARWAAVTANNGSDQSEATQ